MKKRLTSQNVGLLIYFIIVVCFVALRIFSSLGMLNFLGKYSSYVFSFVVQVLILFGLSVFLFSAIRKKKVKKVLKDYRFNKISPSMICLCVLLGVVVFFLNIFVSSFFNSILSWIGYSSGGGSAGASYPVWLFFVNIIFVAILPGVCEEVAHRGMLFKATEKTGIKKTIILSALMFGLIHLNIEQFFYATIIGLLLGTITYLTNSIYPAMIIHFMNNAINVYISFANKNDLFAGDLFARLQSMISTNIIIGMIFVFCFLTLLVCAGVFIFKQIAVIAIKSKLQKSQQEISNFLTRQEFLFDVKISDMPKENLSHKVPLDFSKVIFPKKEKFDTFSKIFLYSSIALMSVVTIFTFIWGIL